MTSSIQENFDWLSKERKLWDNGFRFIAGVDEAGRGPLAGPVVAAAVVIEPGKDLPGIRDSKKMNENQRHEAYSIILNNSLAIAVCAASVGVIDRMNILKATMYAMRRTVMRLKLPVDYVLIDGNRYPDGLEIPGESIVGGDGLCRSIAAASIIAKVTRDRLMRRLDRFYPQYKWSKNKGYGTPEHLHGISEFGPSVHHRFSFSPIRQINLGFEDD